MRKILLFIVLFGFKTIETIAQVYTTLPGQKPFGTQFISLPDSIVSLLGIAETENDDPVIFMDDSEVSFATWLDYSFTDGQLDSGRLPVNNKKFEEYLDKVIDFSRRKIFWKNGSELGLLPISGITYEQAVAYCAWRTNLDLSGIDTEQYEFINEYQLPTAEIYEFLLQVIEQKDSLDDAGFHQFHYNGVIDSTALLQLKKRSQIEYTREFYRTKFGKEPIERNTYYPNTYGLYDIVGNLSEMTKSKGLAKGCSYVHSAASCMKGQDIYYDKEELWLGFRCLIVLKSNPFWKGHETNKH